MQPMQVTARYVSGVLLALGLLSCAVILGTTLWLTVQINKTDQAAARRLLTVTVTDLSNSLGQAVIDYTDRDLAFQVVTQGDEEAIYENLGSGASESGLFDEIHLLSPGGDIRRVYGNDPDDVSKHVIESDTFSNLVTQISNAPIDDMSVVKGFVENNGTLAVVSAARLTPDDRSELIPGQSPVLVGVRLLGEQRIAALAKASLRPSLSVTSTLGQAHSDGDIASLELPGIDGTRAGYITWDMPQSGTDLAYSAAPGILVACLAILMICLSAARYFDAQNAGLARAIELAETDALTGLLNRAGLSTIVASAHFKSQLMQGKIALLSMDMNGFKLLNDTLGHAAGDQALCVMADILRQATRTTDHCMRLGGDEFLCIIFDNNPRDAALKVAARLEEATKQPVQIDGETIQLSASVGISASKVGSTDWSYLLERSDQAMYSAKQCGRLTQAHFHVATLPAYSKA